jgi:hypothetical protein
VIPVDIAIIVDHLREVYDLSEKTAMKIALSTIEALKNEGYIIKEKEKLT